jgi:dihydrofolate reductase
MTELALITAMDDNRLIGRDNALPWHLPADFAFFKRTTMGKPVIMGRKTWESIGRPLPGRRNLVVTRNTDYPAGGGEICNSIGQALERCREAPEAFLIGGSSLYRQALEQGLARILWITHVHGQFEGDAWFPEIDPLQWKEVWREERPADEANPYPLSFVKYLTRT